MKKLLLSLLLIAGIQPTTNCSRNYLGGIAFAAAGMGSIYYGAKQLEKGFKKQQKLDSPYLGLLLNTQEEKDAQKKELKQKMYSKYAIGFGALLLGGIALYVAKDSVTSK